MTLRLVYTERAERDIKALDSGTKRRIGLALRKLERDPFTKSKRLTQPALGTFRFRVRD